MHHPIGIENNLKEAGKSRRSHLRILQCKCQPQLFLYAPKTQKRQKIRGSEKLAPLPAVLDQPDRSYPDLHLYKIEAQDIESGVRK